MWGFYLKPILKRFKTALNCFKNLNSKNDTYKKENRPTCD